MMVVEGKVQSFTLPRRDCTLAGPKIFRTKKCRRPKVVAGIYMGKTRCISLVPSLACLWAISRPISNAYCKPILLAAGVGV